MSFGGGLVECSVNQCLAESGEASSSGAKNCVVGEESFNRCGDLNLISLRGFHVTNQLILFLLSALWGPPSPHPLRTSYMEAP